MDLDVFGNSDCMCVAIEVRDDGLFEEAMEQFTVILSASDNVDISSQRNTATVIFIDNEGVDIGFDYPNYPVNENGGTFQVCIGALSFVQFQDGATIDVMATRLLMVLLSLEMTTLRSDSILGWCWDRLSH